MCQAWTRTAGVHYAVRNSPGAPGAQRLRRWLMRTPPARTNENLRSWASMGDYSARHILLVPNLVSLTRLPLAALFVACLDTPWLALTVLLGAGATDMIDGWYARRFSQVTATGAVIDGITDKAFMATVVVSLILADRLSLFGALLLATREVGELPLVLWWALHRSKRQARAENPRANAVGKLCTSVQFVAVSAALFQVRWLEPVLVLSGVLGVVAALYYWRRETRT